MARVHLLNVDPGDCTIIQHNTGRVTMVDVCDGNIVWPTSRAAHSPRQCGQAASFRMCTTPTNPIAYLKDLGIEHVYRFVLTHPDMDHMDGFNALLNQIEVTNFWDSGARRDKPSFAWGPFREADWDRYVNVREGNEPGVISLQPLAGADFQYANMPSDGSDGLHVLAPDTALLNDCNMNDDVNEGSYVLLYRVGSNRIVLSGDAHDSAWDYIARSSYAGSVRNASFLLAPHHGRDSGRSYDFLDYLKPSLTLIGSAPSAHIDYSQWTRRGLEYITSNQCGNVVLESASSGYGDFIAVYVENIDFARSRGAGGWTNGQGYGFLRTISAIPE